MKKKLVIHEYLNHQFILIHVIDTDKTIEILKRIREYCGGFQPIVDKENYTLENKILIQVEKESKWLLFASKMKIKLVNHDATHHHGIEYPHPLECDYSNLEELLEIMQFGDKKVGIN